MHLEHFDKIVETANLEEVNKLCSDGWILIDTVGIKNRSDNQAAFVYSFGKKANSFISDAIKSNDLDF